MQAVTKRGMDHFLAPLFNCVSIEQRFSDTLHFLLFFSEMKARANCQDSVVINTPLSTSRGGVSKAFSKSGSSLSQLEDNGYPHNGRVDKDS